MTQRPPNKAPLAVLPRELGQLPQSPELVGEKAARLAELMVLKARVPRFGVVTSAAFDLHLEQPEIQRALEAARADDLDDEARRIAHGDALMRAVAAATVQEAIADAIIELADAFAPGDLLAVRASPVGDAVEIAALAGALETLLFVRRGQEVVEAVRHCFASALGPRALAARFGAGLPLVETRLAVVVQRMVQSEVSGACITVDAAAEISAASTLVVDATYGLSGGSSLGAGERRILMDRYLVTRPLDPAEGIDESALVLEEIVEKQEAVRFDDERGFGSVVRPVPSEERARPTLSAQQVRALATEALRLEAEMGRPLRLVFGVAGRLVHLVEARPLVATRRRLKSARLRVWDQRLLPGGLAGPTTPLTYSLVRGLASRVAQGALPSLGADKRGIEQRRAAAERLFGFLGGRIYANVTAFRALLELLPWHEQALGALARGFGVPDLHEGAVPTTGGEPVSTSDGATLARLARLLRKVDDDAQSFLPTARERLAALRTADLDLEPDRLLDLLDELEDLLARAGTSLALLSVLCAAQYDLAERLLHAGGVGDAARVLNDLLGGEPDDNAVGLARALFELVRLLREAPRVDELLRTSSSGRAVLERLSELGDERAFAAKLDEIVERHGGQTVQGLKLESPTLRSRPELIIDLLRSSRAAKAPDLDALASTALGTRKKAEYFVEGQLGGRGLLAVSGKARAALKAAERLREAIALREQVRRALVDAVGISRSVVVALGERLFEHELLDRAGDVFFLALDEVRGLVRGTSLDARPRAIIAARKRDASRAARALPDRLETSGVVATAAPTPKELPGDDGNAHSLFGVPISSGEQHGRAVVLRSSEEPFAAPFSPESVVVVERLDAGLLPRLVAARAVIAEGASVLDHVAVALRALGIPVVGGIARATEHIEPGEPLHVNGSTGRVHLVLRMPAEIAPSLESADPEEFARLAAPSDPEVLTLPARLALRASATAATAATTATATAISSAPRPPTLPVLTSSLPETVADPEATEPSYSSPAPSSPRRDASGDVDVDPTDPSLPTLSRAPPGPPPLTDPDGEVIESLDDVEATEVVDEGLS